MRSDLTRGLRPMAAVLLLVLAIAVVFAGLTNSPRATAAAPEECGTATETPTETPTASPLAEAPTAASQGDCETGEPTSPGTTDSTATEPSTTEPTATVPTTEPTTTAPGQTGEQVEDAIFRWGVNNQSNARSHNPASINLLSAGLANPGKAGRELLAEDWRARQGNVRIEKWNGPKQGWLPATWSGIGTNATGKKQIGAHGPYSNHNVVISNGRGVVDRAAGSATVAWSGTFSIVYYGGNAIFAIKDPVLEVRNGQGVVRADLLGFATDSLNPSTGGAASSQWELKRAADVKILDLGRVKLGKTGFTLTPRYRGQEISNGSATQLRTGKDWGSYPPEFVGFLATLGIHDQFWYSTGLTTDDTKLPLPLTVSLTANEVAPEPEPEPEQPDINNSLTTPPPLVTPPANNTPPVAGPSAPATVAGPSGAPSLLATDDLTALRPVAATTPPATQASDGWLWWLAGSLTLIAALMLFVPSPSRRPTS